MDQQVRVIKTEREYHAALARLSALMDQDIVAGSDDEATLDLLAVVIADYERTKVAPAVIDPIDAILLAVDQRGLSKKDLAPFIGSTSKVSEVLARKRPLSLSMIRKLHRALDIPADVLLSGSDNEDIDLSETPHYDYSKFPLAEMLDRGYFGKFAGGIKLARAKAEELVRGFMHGVSPDGPEPALLRAPLQQSGARTMDDYALLVWRVAVLKKSRKIALTGKYKPGVITTDWLQELARLSAFDSGPKLAQEYLAQSGIALVIEAHFKRTYLDGAAMLDGDTPVVALTLRYDRVDNFWFALLHELVHVQNHLTPSHLFIADNLDDKTRANEKAERDADAGAGEALIPSDEWEQSAVRTAPTAENALALARKLRIHPAIVAGRVRHETGNWRLLTNLNKGEVRRHFE
jgi:HTH-type transcriptional regulator/antitoxin HigA